MFLLRDDTNITSTELNTILDLTRSSIGNKTCSRARHGYKFAVNGSEYVDAADWEMYCGVNKGYGNPYAGNYSRH